MPVYLFDLRGEDNSWEAVDDVLNNRVYVAQIKGKFDPVKRDNYNIGEDQSKDLVCPAEKETAIFDALKHLGMF